MNYKQRYLSAMRRMQSGVQAEMDIVGMEGAGASPKHLRVGFNAAMTDSASLARLLVAKGIITDDELQKALAEGAEAEVQRFEDLLYRLTGRKVTLGEAGSLP